MDFKTYFEHLNVKYEFWTFVSINFPQFYRNIRHLLAVFSYLFVWSGFWLIYDEYFLIFEENYQTFVMLNIISFFLLCLLQAAKSINEPLSNIDDENQFFLLYPHFYVSILHRKISQSKFFQQNYERRFFLFFRLKFNKKENQFY